MTNILTIIIVNYKTKILINNIEKSIKGTGFRIIVVDNSNDFLASSESTLIIKGHGNVGFGVGCNLGATYVDTKLTMFLNPDTKIDNSTLISLIELSLCEPDSIIGPVVGINKNEYSTLVSYNRFFIKYIRRKKKINNIELSDIEVPFVSGACMIIHTNRFKILGGYPIDVFMYAEDLYLGEKNTELAGKNKLISKLFVQHIGGLSSDKNNFYGKFCRYKNSVNGHFLFFIKNNNKFVAIINSLYLASGIKI